MIKHNKTQINKIIIANYDIIIYCPNKPQHYDTNNGVLLCGFGPDCVDLNPLTAKLFNLNFHQLEVVSR